MVTLDTNVISALMLAAPETAGLKWSEDLESSEFNTTAINVAEIYQGILILPEGKKRSYLLSRFEKLFKEVLTDILPFDQKSAKIYGQLKQKLKSIGRPVAQADLMIAAIIAQHNATLITRNTKDFEYCDIKVINPFE